MGFSFRETIKIIIAGTKKKTIEHKKVKSSVVFFVEKRCHIGSAAKYPATAIRIGTIRQRE